MLRLVQIGQSMPLSFPVDPTATFQPGQIAQMKVIGNEIVCGVSDGTAPLGIIDEINTAAFTAPVQDEVVVVPLASTDDGYGNRTSTLETEKRLANSNIVRSSFVANVDGLVLYETNGVIAVPAGTTLNYDSDGDGVVDSLRTIVSYVYRISNIPGDNTTIGSGRITIWIDRGIYDTDQYDSTQIYAVNSTLFCNGDGLLTTAQPTASHPGIAMVTGPPTSLNSTLEFMWL